MKNQRNIYIIGEQHLSQKICWYTQMKIRIIQFIWKLIWTFLRNFTIHTIKNRQTSKMNNESKQTNKTQKRFASYWRQSSVCRILIFKLTQVTLNELCTQSSNHSYELTMTVDWKLLHERVIFMIKYVLIILIFPTFLNFQYCMKTDKNC